MNVGFVEGLLTSALQYLPLVAGTYVGFLILRFPDLTVEASWCLAGIVACLLCSFLPPLLAVAAGTLMGALCGCFTSAVFVWSGRSKLLAGIIAYYILQALGYHLLGKQASIYLDRPDASFGFPLGTSAPLLIYLLLGLLALSALVVWQHSKAGVSARVLGATPRASLMLRMGLVPTFAAGLIFSNALVGLGGAAWSVYYGQASNVQGIGIVLKAMFAVLIGDEVLRLLGIARRSDPAAALLGAACLALLIQGSQFLQAKGARFVENWPFRPTDHQILIGLLVLALLWFRRGKFQAKGDVSPW